MHNHKFSSGFGPYSRNVQLVSINLETGIETVLTKHADDFSCRSPVLCSHGILYLSREVWKTGLRKWFECSEGRSKPNGMRMCIPTMSTAMKLLTHRFVGMHINTHIELAPNVSTKSLFHTPQGRWSALLRGPLVPTWPSRRQMVSQVECRRTKSSACMHPGTQQQ